MYLETWRGKPTRRRWLLIGRALDERRRMRGLSFCWVTGMWAFWIRRGKRPRYALGPPAEPLHPACRCAPPQKAFWAAAAPMYDKLLAAADDVRPVVPRERVVNRDEEG